MKNIIANLSKSLAGREGGRNGEISLKWRLRTSGSISQFEDKALKIWNIKKAKGKNDLDGNKVFFGLYHLNDWRGFIAHRGKRFVLWAGGDLFNLERGYAFSDGKELAKSKRWSFIPWHLIFRIFKAEHYCENESEFLRLYRLGIGAKIVPSFLEDVNNFDVCFKPSKKPNVYISAREGNSEAYGEFLIKRIAPKVPDTTFHFYGIARPCHDNIVYHGNVSAERFNQEIRNYQGCIRANESDGFSELVAKASLMGQYAISRIRYDEIWNYRTEEDLIFFLKLLAEKTEPNLKAKEWVLNNVNKYPWNYSAIK